MIQDDNLSSDPSRQPAANDGNVTTGVTGLDDILGGGFVEGGLYLIEGMAGAGKTILSSQIGFHRVNQGDMVLYITLIAESHTKLLSHLRALSFYNDDAISDRMLFVSGYHELMRDGLSGFLALIAATIKTSRPRFMVIDGFRSAREFSSTELELSQFIHELSAFVSAARCTTLILAPLSGNEPHPEHTLVDGLIELNRYNTGMRRAREIEVHKLRARDHLLGKHFFKITEDGLVTFPRIESSAAREQDMPDFSSRLSFGFADFDQMLGGGVVRGSTTTLVGPSGVGKTLLSLKFLQAGAERGERCVYFGFYESPERLIAKAQSVGIDLASAVQDGRLTVHWHPAVELAIDELAVELVNAVRRSKASRLVVDGVDGFLQSANRTERFGLFLNALSHRLREAGVTTILTEEMPLFGDAAPPATLRASAMTENIVFMRYVEANSSLYRMVSIVKQREGAHDSSIRRLTIDARGLHISEGFIGPTGLLSGHPSIAPALSVSDPGARQ
ncbi:ATPase domain-containing protein [Caballeronia insecticola]|uniref:non-specific serine/threonine protein kinase n=1 Tax=Caballeronia insecticola TaxID=758793 RepID=R4X1D0_9BURK|nr:ATPase domain-containing protein [Caballeronia insecticola]BAN24917.1 Non-specific serine/threonine protein kinase [Caballeronia insecticola]